PAPPRGSPPVATAAPDTGARRPRNPPRRDLAEFEDADSRQRSVAFSIARPAHAGVQTPNPAQRITTRCQRVPPIPRLAPSPALLRAADRRRSCGHVAAPGPA